MQYRSSSFSGWAEKSILDSAKDEQFLWSRYLPPLTSLLGEVVEKLDLTEMDNREELNKAMQERGFRLKPEYRSRRGGAAAGAAGRGREGAAVAARLMRGGRDDGEL